MSSEYSIQLLAVNDSNESVNGLVHGTEGAIRSALGHYYVYGPLSPAKLGSAYLGSDRDIGHRNTSCAKRQSAIASRREASSDTIVSSFN